MKVTVIGTGYVGLTSGAMFAGLGHHVTCVDIDQLKIKMLSSGKIPFYEPGLDSLVQKHLGKNLFFAPDLTSTDQAKVVLVAVGTPPAPDGSPDLSNVLEVAGQLIPYLKKYKVIILKSTVPPGTNKVFRDFLLNRKVSPRNFDIVSNPEFLREGSAVWDSFNPDRIVIGSASQKAIEITRSLYQRIECPVVVTSNEAAEMIKYASNAFLAAKISFINELAGICEEYGVDINEVARGMGYDHRIGPYFLKAGAGYGGSCLPKDLSGLIYLADRVGIGAPLLKAVQQVNTDQASVVVSKLEKALGDLKDKRIAVWGLAFKPETDDMRFAPAISVINSLMEKGAVVAAFDPAAMDNARSLFPAAVEMHDDKYAAARDSKALVVMTEWKEFAEADLAKLKNLMNSPIVIDGRNIYSPELMASLGFVYWGIGR